MAFSEIDPRELPFDHVIFIGLKGKEKKEGEPTMNRR